MANFRLPMTYKEPVDRAVHNLSRFKRTTAHAMTAIPLYSRRMFPGDTFYFSTPQMLLQSQPTYAPIMGTYRLRVEWYFDSDNNRYGWKDNNDILTTEETLNRARHRFKKMLQEFNVDTTNQLFGTQERLNEAVNVYQSRNMVNRGSLMDFLGMSPNTMLTDVGYGSEINLDSVITYLNIMRCYHVNPQFPDMPYISSAGSTSVSNPNNPFVFDTFNLTDMDNLMKAFRYASNGLLFTISDDADQTVSNNLGTPANYQRAIRKFYEYLKSTMRPHGGLFCTQYEPDLYRNLLNSDIDLVKSVLTPNSDGTISIEQFRFKNRLQMIIDRIAVVAGRRSDVVRSRWGVSSHKGRDIPQLIAVQSEYIDTSLVTSNNAGSNIESDINSVPGDMAGNVNQRKFPKGTQKFTADEEGILMAIVTITPLVDYAQNIERDLLDVNFEDSFSPQMARRGFESVPLSDYVSSYEARLTGTSGNTLTFVPRALDDSVGKQIAWLREMTDTNRVHGEFCPGGIYETWTLTRRYAPIYSKELEGYDGTKLYLRVPSTEVNITPYGNPLEWQYPFVNQTLGSPNFYLQIDFKVKGVRPIGRRYMPTLG